ncbi:VWA domain-containing protein [Terrihabitans sp. B22-R8]|uniref:VWA domain-containing protein n=1 Tax=Terrihabitans sp. B22-R8 TaxID=3425128 RepID=UPI00403CDF34
MSRQPTWDRACALQSEMFDEAAGAGGLAIQLVYFRGYGECKASRWLDDSRALAGLMSRIDCRGGHTQIGRVLAYVRNTAEESRVAAFVFIGDAMEERLDDLCQIAGQLGLLGIPAFVFQEGRDVVAENAFREIARLTRGAYGRFDQGAVEELRRLLRAAAAYAAQGRAGLERLSRNDPAARLMLSQMR